MRSRVHASALTRVVPPTFRSLKGKEISAVFCAHKQSQKVVQSGRGKGGKNGGQKVSGSDHCDGR